MENLKICIVSDSFKGGGVQRVAVNLANRYASQGYEIILVIMKGKQDNNEIAKNVKVISLNLSRIRLGIFKLASIFRSEKPNSILSVSPSTNVVVGLAHYFYSVPHLIFREPNLLDEIFAKGYWESLLYIKAMQLTYARASVIIANSKDTKQNLIKNKITNDEKIKVIPNPVVTVNLQSKKVNDCNHSWLINNNYKVVISVGRLTRQKNHSLLIKAFAKVKVEIKNAKLIILGNGDLKKYLLNLSKSFGLEEDIDFVKYQDNPYPFYKEADVFVLSSIYEGFGNVIVEALACGTPVISTNCPGGPKDILENGKYGKLVPVDDVDAMAEAIISTLTQVDEHDATSLRIQRSQDFSVEKIANDYLCYLTNSI